MLVNLSHVVVRSGEYLRAYMHDFMEAFAPQWTRRPVRAEVERQTAGAPTRTAGRRLDAGRQPRPRVARRDRRRRKPARARGSRGVSPVDA
jgi:hypothetical protein